MTRLIDRAKNEPALLVALLLAALNLGFGVDVDLAEVETLRAQLIESGALLLGGLGIRQSVWGPRTHQDEVVDAASHAAQREHDLARQVTELRRRVDELDDGQAGE